MTFLTANGITVEYADAGKESDPAVLLIAGLGTQMIRWTKPFCERLVERGFRVIRFDNRDTGLSTHLTDQPAPDFSALARAIETGRTPMVPYTLHDMAADAIGVLDALRVDRAHVVGRSMGGMIAQLMASDHPQRVLSLTAIMSSTANPGLPAAAPDVMAMLTTQPPDPAENEEAYVAHRLAFARRIAGSGFVFDERAHRDLVLEECRRAYDPAGVVRQIAAIGATGDVRSRLARIVAPTLVIHGSDDCLIPPACGEDVAASIHGAIFLLIDGMGHDLPADLDETVVEAICSNARRQPGDLWLRARCETA
jgi:pimeloyl-ACP methyl ester carboxylesterase